MVPNLTVSQISAGQGMVSRESVYILKTCSEVEIPACSE